METMKAEEMILARRVLEAGRTVAKEELLEPPNESRNWPQELREAGLEKVWQLECQLAPVVASMRKRGLGVDAKKLAALAQGAEKTRQEAEKKVQEVLGAELNPRSPKQVKEALEKRGLKLKSTDEVSLVMSGDPAAELVLQSRGAEKRAQMISAYREAVGKDGRIHAEFDPLGTATGRFSCREPNLQNVGRDVEMRSCFVADPKKVLVIADYSQVELRVAAFLAKEEAMLAAFRSGQDIHSLTAGKLSGKSPEKVGEEERKLAKAVNFGLLYGMSARGLAEYGRISFGLRLDEKEAREFRRKFFEAYPALQRWHDEARQSAEDPKVKEVRTLYGRRRWLPPPGGRMDWARFTALVNTPVQGTCGDALKRAMVSLADAPLVSTVHDELILEVPEKRAETMAARLSEVMREGFAGMVPEDLITVAVRWSASWGG
jgi:DNA polymerase-1